MHLGETARQVRKTLGLTQREAAEMLGISDVHLCHVEKGRATPSLALIQRYQQVFGVDLYVYDWCQRKELDGLPRRIQESAKELAALMKLEIKRSLGRSDSHCFS